MERGISFSLGRRRHLARGAASVLLVLAMAACTAKANPSPVASPVGSGGLSGSGKAGSASPSPIWTLPASSLKPDYTGGPSPTPTPRTGPLPTVGPVPAGEWTGMYWIDIPGGHSPNVPVQTGVQTGPADDPGVTLEGWSKGYVEFVWDAHARTVTPWASPDGLSWRQGAKLDISAWTAYFKTYDATNNGSDPQYHDNCSFNVGNFQQGPGTLLVQGFVVCNPSILCSGGYDNNRVIWTSSDGLTWTPGKLPYTDPDHEDTISGGTSGFIGLDRSTSHPKIWVSSDGQSWRQGALPAAAETTGSSVSYPVSFSAGFVLPGVVMVKNGSRTADGGCGGTVDTRQYQGALWWSPDGSTWTRASLSGASPSSDGINMNVARLDDHTVVAEQMISDTDKIEWVSTDGKTWTRLEGNPIEIIGNILIGPSISDNTGSWVGLDRSIVWTNSLLGLDLSVFDAHFNLVNLSQAGDVMSISWLMALGPTGLLATQDGSRFWMGVPTTG